MNWLQITRTDQIQQLIEESEKHPVLIFKHSTRCGISSMALSRLERSWNDNKTVIPYFLDLIRFRDVSNEAANYFNVPHESPQVLLLKDGKVVYTNSHMGINYSDIEALARNESSHFE